MRIATKIFPKTDIIIEIPIDQPARYFVKIKEKHVVLTLSIEKVKKQLNN